METLDNETQMIAVEKVLEEMQKAEEYVKNWNACWYEQLLDAHCLPLHYEIGEADVRDMERKYEPRYRLANAYHSGDSIGIPLAKETLVGDNTLTGERNINFECEFGRIDWFGMHSHKATRHFSFNNNGIIEFSKSATNNSCAGKIVISFSISVDLCEESLKYLIESTSSPQNSILTPIVSESPTSKIPPRMQNCPLFSTKSTLSYPNSTNVVFSFSREYVLPVLKSTIFLYNSSFEIIFCIIASIVVTIAIGLLSFLAKIIWFSTDILS